MNLILLSSLAPQSVPNVHNPSYFHVIFKLDQEILCSGILSLAQLFNPSRSF